jgi:Ni,Fe-hydrogenase maturation factor
LYLLGCEPAVLETEDGRMELSKPVAAAVPEAIEMLQSLIARIAQKDAT